MADITSPIEQEENKLKKVLKKMLNFNEKAVEELLKYHNIS